MKRYRWIDARKAEGFPITAACEVAEVATSSFYAWCQRSAAPTDAEWDEAVLVNAMVDLHRDSDATYGSPRMTPALRRQGFCVNHKRTERRDMT
jgi:hypothetical protein